MNPTLDIWLPLISTITGGIIALVSAFLAARYQSSVEFRRAHLERTFEKAEELYELLLKTEHLAGLWSMAYKEDNHQFLKPPPNFDQIELKKIEMISGIYLPELKDSTEQVIKRLHRFGRLVMSCFDPEKAKEIAESANGRTKDCEQAFEDAKDSIDRLKTQIVDLVQESRTRRCS